MLKHKDNILIFNDDDDFVADLGIEEVLRQSLVQSNMSIYRHQFKPSYSNQERIAFATKSELKDKGLLVNNKAS